MAQRPDVARVRRGYQAFASGGMKMLSEVIAQAASQAQLGMSAMAGEQNRPQTIPVFS